MQKWLLILATLFTSCRVANFDRYPGTPLPEMPTVLTGNYYLVLSPGLKKTDTAFYRVTSNTIGYNTDTTAFLVKEINRDYVLSSIVPGTYVLSMRNEEDTLYWNCVLYRADAKGLLMMPVMENDDQFGKYKFRKSFLKMSESGDSLFSYKMNETTLMRYIRKEFKAKNSIKLKRLPN
jgi:hypothetical protein